MAGGASSKQLAVLNRFSMQRARLEHLRQKRRIAKFIVGWGSHLCYWVYPGVMVGVTGIFVGYVVGFLYPSFMNGTNPGPVFMALVAVVFSFFVAWIAQKGAGASTAVNIAINVIQISALVVFSVLALGYRVSHP